MSNAEHLRVYPNPSCGLFPLEITVLYFLKLSMYSETVTMMFVV